MIRYTLPRLILLGVVALAAEVTVLATQTLWGARLELLLLLACFAALYSRDRTQAVWACWTLGFLKDLASPTPLGLFALLFLAAGWAIARMRQVLFREHPLTQAGVAFACAAAVVLVDALAAAVSAGRLPWDFVLARAFSAALFAAAAAPVVIYVVTRPKWLLR